MERNAKPKRRLRGKQHSTWKWQIQRLHNSFLLRMHRGQQRHPILIDMLRSFEEPLELAINDTRIYQPRPLVNCPMPNLRSRFQTCCVAEPASQPASQPNKTHTHPHTQPEPGISEKKEQVVLVAVSATGITDTEQRSFRDFTALPSPAGHVTFLTALLQLFERCCCSQPRTPHPRPTIGPPPSDSNPNHKLDFGIRIHTLKSSHYPHLSVVGQTWFDTDGQHDKRIIKEGTQGKSSCY